VRGALSAVILLGIATVGASLLLDVPGRYVHNTWAVLNLTVAVLLFLLLVSLFIRGGVGLVKLIRESS
jgi:succinate dehydrogenase hydrophobic anchor subunit